MNFYPPIVAALVSALLIATILRSKWGTKVQDIPNERSLHAAPTPRIGGVGLMAGILAGWTLLFASLQWWLLLPLLGLLAVSFLDDIYSLPVKQRLSVQLLAALLLVVGSGLLAQQGVVVGVAILLLTVWMTNLYNFMDGSDGMAGGMALFGFGVFGVAALQGDHENFALLNFSVAAAALGFLFFNFPKARVFMGDAGSIPLGFLVAALGLWGWQLGYWPAWFPLLVFSPFIADASVTLVRRSLRGVKITEAHREHYYQRAVQMGWKHRNVALLEYVLMLCAGISALCSLGRDLPWQVFLFWGGIYGALMLVLDLRWKNFKRI
ncbi:MAG: glycosyltransferase family 4 protein [Sideroxydans sp.]|nr:glycosyltransferase family 4 protein [Sideroxydans sp.]